MPRLLLLLATLLSTPVASQGRPLRVLFIGNSYTYFNNVPGMVADLARHAKNPRTVDVAMVVRGGATLRDHWLSGDALATLRRGRWDFVVLQEQSMLGVRLEDGRPAVNDPVFFHRFARLFAAEIRRAGAVPVFYLTWSRRATPARQGALTDAYAAIAAETDALVAPVGEAWQDLRRRRPDLELYDPDGSHPSPVGSYLAAITLWSTLAHRPATGLPPRVTGRQVADSGLGTRLSDRTSTLASLPDTDAVEIQRAVDRAANTMRLRPRVRPAATAPGAAPTAPALSLAQLAGRWVGTMSVYDDPVDVEFVVSSAGGSWRGEWRERGQGWSATRVIDDLRVEAGALAFSVPDPRFLAPGEGHRATMQGDTLVGRVAVGSALEPPYLTGGWRLARATSPR